MSTTNWLKKNYPDIVRILRLVRYESGAWIAHLRGRLSFRQWVTLRRLRQARQLKVNIASGRTKVDGWLTFDVSPAADIRVDLRRPLPLTDGSVLWIFCEHFCDHLNFPFAITKFLAECRRVLETGGRARFVLHDARDLMRAYVANDVHYFKVADVAAPTMIEAVNKLFRHDDFHQFFYDYAMFEKLLYEVGFSKVIQRKFRESEIAELVLDFDHSHREMMSMYIEAIR